IAPLGADGAAPNLPARKASIDEFLKRNAEVLEKDREEFQAYLVAKQAAATAAPAPQPAPARRTRMSRRTMLNVAVGTAGVAEAAVLGYSALGGGSSDTGIFPASGAINGASGATVLVGVSLVGSTMAVLLRCRVARILDAAFCEGHSEIRRTES
ncbi:MAG: hypothetical protein Q8K85_07535, partial [Hyphomicrobium sp.]|nr:hypothetical protein [Hyphomicrobium sp.]